MSNGARLFLSAVFIGYLFVCVRMLRRRQLSSGLTLVWCSAAFVLGPLVAVPHWLNEVSYFVGVSYPPAFYLLLAVVFLSGIGIALARHITRLSEQTRTLAEKIAMLELRDEINLIDLTGSTPVVTSLRRVGSI